jgi:hypothetical protein
MSLRRAPQKALRTVLYSPATFTSLGLYGHAIRHRSGVALLCSSVLLLIPFLRIVVAGLFIISFQPAHQKLQVPSTSTFDEIWVDANLSAQVFALTQSKTFPLPLPAWITTQAAVGEVDFSDLDALMLRNASSVVSLPVIQADLVNCTVLTQSDQMTNVVVLGSGEWEFQLTQQPVHVDGNLTVCDHNSFPTVNQGMENITLLLPEQPGWLGQMYAPQCGGHIILFGRTDPGNASSIMDLTAIQCFDEMKL